MSHLDQWPPLSEPAPVDPDREPELPGHITRLSDVLFPCYKVPSGFQIYDDKWTPADLRAVADHLEWTHRRQHTTVEKK